jgi:intein-encoded DNA endonuclease-like protein
MVVKFSPRAEVLPNLSYLIGILKGDGYVFDNSKVGHYSVHLHVKDRSFVESFAQALTAIGLHPSKPRQDKRGLWKVRAVSVLFFKWYQQTNWKQIALDHSKEFLKGFYESEGSAERRAGLRIYNTNRMLLRFVQRLLHRCGYRTHFGTIHMRYKGQPYLAYRIYIRKHDRQRFINWILPITKLG